MGYPFSAGQAIEIVWETVEFTGNTVTWGSVDHGESWGEQPQL